MAIFLLIMMITGERVADGNKSSLPPVPACHHLSFSKPPETVSHISTTTMISRKVATSLTCLCLQTSRLSLQPMQGPRGNFLGCGGSAEGVLGEVEFLGCRLFRIQGLWDPRVPRREFLRCRGSQKEPQGEGTRLLGSVTGLVLHPPDRVLHCDQ